jgi:AcrR family transcriptional regulator
MTLLGSSPPRTQTKLLILNSAERLFALHGFNATSLRNITTEARVNLGAVNYHFSSKDDLILAVLRRRIRPLNQQRLQLLETFQQQAGDAPIPIQKILEALFRPPAELVARDETDGRYFVRLMAQCLGESGAYLRPLVEEEFAHKLQKFHAAIKRALPFLSTEEIYWRLHFAIGVLLHTIAHADVLELSSGGTCRVTDVEATLRRMVAFCAAGVQSREKEGSNS